MSKLFAASRGLTVSSSAIPSVAGQPTLVPLKLEGSEGINALFDYRLTLQGATSNLSLNAMVGLEISCYLELEDQGNSLGGVREISALITQARFIGNDDRHSTYELTLRPWLYLATLTSDCKVFQNQTPVETIAAVLKDYSYACTTRLVESYPVRDYCVQYNETDFEFINRLMQEWGINYHFEHAGGVHRLVLSDSNGGFQATPDGPGLGGYRSIAFYPLGHKIDEEYIHGFSPVNALTSGSYASRDYDYTRPRADLAVGVAAPRPTAHADQEVFLWRGDAVGLGGSDYSQPNAGTDKAANQTEGQGQQLARVRMQALRQLGLRAEGVEHVRGIVPGRTFSLTGHPQEKANAEYIVLETRLLVENVAEDTQRDAVVALSAFEGLTGRWQVLTEFAVQPTTEVLRPVVTQGKPKVGGPETALVVGPGDDIAASNIYTDALGRIKVQFPWDRYGSKNQNSSCWLRVSSAWAGNQLGAMHVPRIGEEVLVEFLEGDPDLPVVTGRLFNQLNMPPWSLPDQQALTGFRSRELVTGGGNSAAGRSNHLVLDDTDGQIQAQLKSDHQHSQLSLGFITRIEDNAGRKDVRGQGFELRTDGTGALRAKDGMLITTEARAAAQAHVKDMGETTARLAQAQDQHQSLGALASQHLAQQAGDQDEVAADLQTQNAAIKGTAEQGGFPELNEPHLVFASPAGIASTTPGSTHQHSGRHHAITSGGHTSISTAKSLLVSARSAVRMFAYKSGIKLVSAAANIEAQALDKSLRILAKVSITETADSITLTAKEELSINGAGSFSNFKGGSITHGTAGVWEAHAAVKAMEGAQSIAAVLPPTGSKDSIMRGVPSTTVMWFKDLQGKHHRVFIPFYNQYRVTGEPDLTPIWQAYEKLFPGRKLEANGELPNELDMATLDIHVSDDLKTYTATLIKGEQRVVLPMGEIQLFDMNPSTHWPGQSTPSIEVVKRLQGGPDVIAQLPTESEKIKDTAKILGTATSSLDSTGRFSAIFTLRDQNKRPISRIPYKITLEDGSVIRGITNGKGETKRVYTDDKPLQMQMSFDHDD